MFKNVDEIENINGKVVNIMRSLHDDNLINTTSISSEVGIPEDEVEPILGIMKQSEYIEMNNNEYITISDYGKMILNGKIQTGYAPV